MAKTMHVYFTDKGDIKSITPVVDNTLNEYKSVEFELSRVQDFLVGKKNIHRYAVVDDKETSSFKIVSKETEQDQISTLNTYLSEVTYEYYHDYDILIEHNTIEKHLFVTMSGTADPVRAREQKNLISNFRKLTFYFTLFGDPNMLLCSFDVPVQDLIDGKVYVNLEEYEDDELNNATLFTKKILGKYHYRKITYK